MSKTIHIVTSSLTPLRDCHLIAKLTWHWKQSGYKIAVGSMGSIPRDIDLAILHIDKTHLNSEDIALNPLEKPFLNNRVLDISKRNFSKFILTRTDNWDGAVIIKSNFNCYGRREWKIHSKSLSDTIRHNLARLSWRHARMLPPDTYPVLARQSDVPHWVWDHPDLIVERFMPEREGDEYCIRGWLFFGSHGYTYRLYSKNPVIKAGTSLRYEFLGEPPAELQDFRSANGWDFGKFDYVMVGDQPVLLDINKTPSLLSAPDTPRVKYLASAIEEYFS